MGGGAAQPAIDRSRTAIVRGGASRPIRLAIEGGVLSETQTFFDYGCGRGEDIKVLTREGYQATGWDPVHAKENALEPADVVQIGYVLNVIEHPGERVETLGKAWNLAGEAMVVAVQTTMAKPKSPGRRFSDGFLTSRGTFQKYFEQSEALDLIKTVTSSEPAVAAPGVFVAFRSEEARLAYLSRRRRRRFDGFQHRLPRAERIPRPRRENQAKKRQQERYELRLAAVAPLMDLLLRLGRWPTPGEYSPHEQAFEHFRSTKAGLRFAEDHLDPFQWETAQTRKRDDLLVDLALARFGGRPTLSQLSPESQLDVKGFFGSYKKALVVADELLFRSGDMKALVAAAKETTLGKRLPDSLYVHVSGISELPALLRIYEGCAAEFVGETDANLVKLDLLREHSVSYLSYPAFEKEAHPALVSSLRFSLAHRRLVKRDFSESKNPPVLHRKETFLPKSHPLFERFDRLTKQEVKHGLLRPSTSIGYRDRWEAWLATSGWELRGHRLVRRKSD